MASATTAQALRRLRPLLNQQPVLLLSSSLSFPGNSRRRILLLGQRSITIHCRQLAAAGDVSSDVQALLCYNKRFFSSSSNPGNQRATASTSVTADIKITTRDEEDDESPVGSATSSSSLSAYASLAKAKLSALVVTTTAAGFVAAASPVLSQQLDVLAACVVGTALCASSAAALNQIVEQKQDALMKRTQQRPLVTGALSTKQATTAAAIWGAAGTSLLYVGTDPVTAALGAGNIALYAGVYTAMKPISIYNTWVGALVGAIPPVMGWSAATGGSFLELQPLLLASTLYLWQMPHFFALSYMHRVDYKRGGFQMVPCLEQDGKETARLIVRYSWYLSAIPVLATATGATSTMFALEGLALNAYFLMQAHAFSRDRTNANARKVFLTSLWYLPCLLMLFLIHSKVWDRIEEEDKKGQRKIANYNNTDDDVLAKFLVDLIHGIRQRGRELCLHEAVVSKSVNGDEACPIVIGNRKSQEGVEAASAVVAHAAAASTTTVTAATAADISDNRDV